MWDTEGMDSFLFREKKAGSGAVRQCRARLRLQGCQDNQHLLANKILNLSVRFPLCSKSGGPPFALPLFPDSLKERSPWVGSQPQVLAAAEARASHTSLSPLPLPLSCNVEGL